jgi:F0F1-type ATP synthase epsilon subunit
MNLFQLEIQTPLQSVFSGEVAKVHMRSDGGDMELMAKHADLTTSISFSPLVVQHGELTEIFILRNAIACFDNRANKLTILALYAQLDKQVDVSGSQDMLLQIKDMLKNPEKLNQYQIKYLENQKIALEKQLS